MNLDIDIQDFLSGYSRDGNPGAGLRVTDELRGWLSSARSFRSICKKMDEAISGLVIEGWEVRLKLDKRKLSSLVLSFRVSCKETNYIINVVRKDIHSLQQECLLQSYISVRSFPLIEELTVRIYNNLDSYPRFTNKIKMVNDAVIQTYRMLSDDVITAVNRRIRASAYVIACSSELKEYVMRIRRDDIRPQIVSLLDTLRGIASFEDIRFFLSEREMLEVMES